MRDLAPHTKNLVIGGVSCWFQPNKTGGFINLGTINRNSLNRKVTRGSQFTSADGVKSLFYTWLQERDMSFDVEAVETTKAILQMALLADAPAAQSQASGSVSSETVVAKLDRGVRLAYRLTTALVLTNSGATVTYTVGTDYTIDTDTGMLTCLSTGTIVADQSLRASYTKGSMTSLTKMNLLQSSRFAGDFMFKVKAENGAKFEYYFPSVEVQPAAALEVNLDGPMKTGAFSVAVLEDTTATAGTEWGTCYELAVAS